MEKERKPRSYWTKEHVFEEARKYTSSTEFYYNNQFVYKKALQNGWLDEMDWINHHDRHERNNWTKEEVFEESRKYTLKKDFRNNNARIYEFAKKNGWLKEMDWLKNAPNPYTDPMYAVYCYKFKDYNTIYVGLSMRPKERAKQHRKEKTSKVYQFANEHGIEVPEMEILINGLYQEDAQLYEDKFKKVSEYTGFNVISIGATGVGVGSLGGVAKALSKAKVFEEARKYTTKKDFREKCHRAYIAAWKNSWLDEMDWLGYAHKSTSKCVYTHKWTKERVFEESRKYTTKKDFKDNYRVAYDAARRNGWLDEMDWLERKHKWTKTVVFEEARKYTTNKEFRKNCKKAYDAARRNGWLDEIDWLPGKQNTVIKRMSEKPNAKRKCWTKDEVFAEARKYNTRKEFSKGNPEVRYIAKANGWLKDMTWLVKKQPA